MQHGANNCRKELPSLGLGNKRKQLRYQISDLETWRRGHMDVRPRPLEWVVGISAGTGNRNSEGWPSGARIQIPKEKTQSKWNWSSEEPAEN